MLKSNPGYAQVLWCWDFEPDSQVIQPHARQGPCLLYYFSSPTTLLVSSFSENKSTHANTVTFLSAPFILPSNLQSEQMFDLDFFLNFNRSDVNSNNSHFTKFPRWLWVARCPYGFLQAFVCNMTFMTVIFFVILTVIFMKWLT